MASRIAAQGLVWVSLYRLMRPSITGVLLSWRAATRRHATRVHREAVRMREIDR
jgi:hypothetical protein